METIFIILSAAILVAGVLYWLWSHIQLTQKKVQLLENAVFELRSMLATRDPEPPAAPIMAPIVEEVIGSSGSSQKPPSEYKDLEDDDWHESAGDEVKDIPLVSTPLEAPSLVTQEVAEENTVPTYVNDDLMPGGRIEIPDEQPLRELNLGDVGVRDDDRFREFFKQSDATTSARTPESLESMPVKELRRLAEQRGIAGTSDMRKKEILSALRQQITPTSQLAIEKHEGTDEEVAAVETAEAEILE